MRSRRDKTNVTIIRVLALGLAAFVVLAGLDAIAGEEAAPAGGSNGFGTHFNKMTALQRETVELEEQIKRLVEEKREADDSQQVRNMTNEIAEKYKDLVTAGKKLEEEANLVRFKYPEQADKLERKYVRFTAKSLKQIEGEVGIDAKLDKIHERVLATFPVPEIEAARHAPPKISPIFLRKPASVSEEDVPEKIILSR